MQNFFNFFRRNITLKLLLKGSALSFATVIYYRRESIVNSIENIYGKYLTPYEERNTDIQKSFWSNLNIHPEVYILIY